MLLHHLVVVGSLIGPDVAVFVIRHTLSQIEPTLERIARYLERKVNVVTQIN